MRSALSRQSLNSVCCRALLFLKAKDSIRTSSIEHTRFWKLQPPRQTTMSDEPLSLDRLCV